MRLFVSQRISEKAVAGRHAAQQRPASGRGQRRTHLHKLTVLPVPVSGRALCSFPRWTKGNVLFASGSPFDPIVDSAGVTHYPAQANNAYIFPAVGYAAVLAQAREITDEVCLAGDVEVLFFGGGGGEGLEREVHVSVAGV